MAVGASLEPAPGYTSGDLSAYLFGSIVTVTDSDVAALAALTAVIIIGALITGCPVMYTPFRPRLRPQPGHPHARDLLSDGRAGGGDHRALDPHHGHRAADLARDDARGDRQLALAVVPHHRPFAAPLVAVAGNVAGLVVSYNFEVPPGAAIIFTLTLTLIMVKLLSLRQKGCRLIGWTRKCSNKFGTPLALHYLCVTKNCDPPHENHSQTRSEVLPRPDGPHVLHRHVRADDEHRVALHRRAGGQGIERRHHHRADDLFHGQHDPDGAAALDAAGGDYDHGQPG